MPHRKARIGLAFASLLAFVLVGCGGHGSSRTTAPSPAPVRILQGIAVSPTSILMSPGQSLQFAAVATYSDGTTTDVTGSVDWSSSNSAIATVNAGGLVEARNRAGSSTISASAQGMVGTATVSNLP